MEVAMSEAARRERDLMTPDEMDEVAERLRELGFDTVAGWIEDGAEEIREAGADGG